MTIQKNFSLFFAFSDTYIQMNPFFSRESMIWGTTKSQGLYGFFCLMRLWDHIKACLGLTTATLGSVLLVWQHLGLTILWLVLCLGWQRCTHNYSQWRLPAAAVKWCRIPQASHRVPGIVPSVKYIYTYRLIGSSQSPCGTGSFGCYPHSLAEQTEKAHSLLSL